MSKVYSCIIFSKIYKLIKQIGLNNYKYANYNNKYMNSNITILNSRKVKLIMILIFIISCTQNHGKETTKSHVQSTNFDLSQKFIKIKAVLSDTIKGEFAIDNGMGITTIDSAFFYTKFDTTKYEFKGDVLGILKEYKGNISFSIDNYKYTIDHFIVRNCNEIGASNVNGIIGSELFLDKIIYIDFDQQLITFSDSVIIDSQYIIVNLFPPYFTIKNTVSNAKFIKIKGYSKILGKQVSGHLQFDLGCQGTDLLVKNSFIKQLKAVRRQQIKNTIVSGIQKANVACWILDSIKIGNYNIKDINANTAFLKDEPNVDAMFMFREGDGYLGLDLMKRFNLITDYKNNVLYIKPNKYFYEKSQRK